MDERATLIKFGRYEHLCQLREEGALYMNTLPHFWGIEDNHVRGDRFECNDEIVQGPMASVRPSMPGIHPTQVGNWTIGVRPPDAERVNLFCMYAARPIAGTLPVDERVFAFGDSALVLTVPDRFIEQVASTIESEQIRAEANLVEYVEDSYVGEAGPFKKLRCFAYQSEWRLVCYDGPRAARILRIGTIRDISVVMRSSEVNQRLRDTGTQLVIEDPH